MECLKDLVTIQIAVYCDSLIAENSYPLINALSELDQILNFDFYA